jgi:Na+-driven multidrug efflux pump
MMFAFNAIKQGQGDNVSPMLFGAISVGINIVLDPIFIFVLNQGIGGAAKATVLARGVIGVLSVLTLFSRRHLLVLEARDLIPNLEDIGKICRLGTGLYHIECISRGIW